jgi:hypothetical protein
MQLKLRVACVMKCTSIYLWLHGLLFGLDRFFSFMIFFTQSVGLLGWEISRPQDR